MAELPTLQVVLVFVLALLGLGCMAFVGLKQVPPAASQLVFLKMVAAVSVAGVAALLPGVLNIDLSIGIKAGGALAVLVLVLDPMGWVWPKPAPLPEPRGDPKAGDHTAPGVANHTVQYAADINVRLVRLTCNLASSRKTVPITIGNETRIVETDGADTVYVNMGDFKGQRTNRQLVELIGSNLAASNLDAQVGQHRLGDGRTAVASITLKAKNSGQEDDELAGMWVTVENHKGTLKASVRPSFDKTSISYDKSVALVRHQGHDRNNPKRKWDYEVGVQAFRVVSGEEVPLDWAR